MLFAIGQRWISESENDLGLGTIIELNHRTLTIDFSAAQTQRTYSRQNAPLIRILLRIGDELTHQQGWKGHVVDILMENHTALYVVKAANNERRTVPEQELSAQFAFSQPQDRLFNTQIDRNEHFTLRYQALRHQQIQYQSAYRGLRGVRANLIPHQLHIAQEVGQRIAPRVLLADEVGLGKTLEAGMILQQQLFSERVSRMLILVPESLQYQWLVEMLRRFDLAFSLFDEERCADFDNQPDINPFQTENQIICALPWLCQHPQRVTQLIEAEFDLLIVDEAHHLHWSEDQPSLAYQCVEQLTQHIPAILLLTATPEQLGEQSHFARLRLLDPHRFYDYKAFVQEQQYYQPVAEAVERLLSNQPLSAVQKQQISQLLQGQWQVEWDRLEGDDEQTVSAKQSLINALIDRHGTSRLLFRNSRQNVQGFPQRIYHPVVLAQPDGEMDTTNWQNDPRFQWLVVFLKDHRHEKILLICHQATTAIQLEQALREREGIKSAVFHEKLSIIERDRAAAYFSQAEGAQILLCSSIGSEGRNFQFACHLILFDVPQHPDLLEQCIGRLDRIGQTRAVHIHLPHFSNSSQALLARWYHEGLNAFEQTCPMGSTLFEQNQVALTKSLQNPTALDEFETLLKQTQQQRQQLKQALEKGRDRLLELHSQGGESAQQLVAQIQQQESNDELKNFALQLFDIIGVEQEDLGENAIVITPTGTMLVPDFPGLKEDGLTVTFDRQQALAREDFAFLTWDHSMIRQGIDLITAGQIGKSAVAFLINPHLPAGTLLLECIYVVETQAPKGLQLNRFLPPTPVRLLLDQKGNNLAAQVSFDKLQKQLKGVDKHQANQIVQMVRAPITALIKHSEKQIQPLAENIIFQAKQQATQHLDKEIQRLIALQKVNKNIRQQEIDSLQQIKIQSLAALDQAHWRLDSLRLIVSNKH